MVVQAMATGQESATSGKRTSGEPLVASENRFGRLLEAMDSPSPIRFNPGTPDHATSSGVGSQSSLSSTMTAEGITLTIKRVIGPTMALSAKDTLRPGFSTSIMPSEATSRATQQNPSESLSGRSPVIDVLQNKTPASAPYQAFNEGKKLPGKLTTQYVMPDGSVITGKGLGRGRPGVKRGPRRYQSSGGDSVGGGLTDQSQGPLAPVAPAGAKRKRAYSDSSNVSPSPSTFSRESSTEYNPTATQTRSGRQTQKPPSLITLETTPSATASPATKKVSTPSAIPPPSKTHPKIKRKVYRGKEQLALCEHCLRGFGPSGNVIVFCDACNKCWHQRCHQPQIPNEIVLDAKAEWFCAACDKILHGNKKSKKPVPSKTQTSTLAAVAPAPPPEQKFGPPFIGATALTLEQRTKYLESLPRERLIGLLLRAGELAPQMPIFETPIPLPCIGPYLQPQFTSDYVTPVTDTGAVVQSKTGSNDTPDEGYDDSYDEHVALYPKTGEGVKLPPEREDLNILLEGPDSRTFSHWVKGMPVKTAVDTVPLHLSWPGYMKART